MERLAKFFLILLVGFGIAVGVLGTLFAWMIIRFLPILIRALTL